MKEEEADGINVDSEVIISEYRLLYLKYKDQIKKYKEAIANLSLKQIINNEEEAWVEHRAEQERIKQEEEGTTQTEVEEARQLQFDSDKIIQNVQSYDFEEEVEQLSKQLKDKISSLRKDYRDLKVFKNEQDIQNAREKLIVFIRKLINDTNFLISSIKKNFERNKRALEAAQGDV